MPQTGDPGTFVHVVNERSLRAALRPHPSVTIEAAAELSGVDIAILRDWTTKGALGVERRGDMDIVQLDEVRVVASRRRPDRRAALRMRLQDAGPLGPSGTLSVKGLQLLARERAS